MNEHTPQHPSEDPERVSPAVEYEQPPTPTPRIYVASLADYNAGRLHGEWIDAAREPWEIQADINKILDSSTEPVAEEWAIHDFDDFGPCRVGEYNSIELVSRIARGIQEHGYAFAAWADVHESDPERFEDLEAAYLGHFASPEDYAEQLADDFGFTAELTKLPTSMQSYVSIDYAAMARDLETEGALYLYPDPSGGYWLFDGNV